MRPFADLATREWIEGQMTGPAPPMYRLAAPAEVAQDALARLERRLAEVGGSAHIDETSGALRFRLPRAAVRDPAAFLALLAHHVDPRHFQPVHAAWDGSDPVAFEMSSRIAEDRLDVVGPGGRVLAYHRPDELIEGEISVRRRTERLPGRWRPAQDVLNRLLRFRDTGQLSIDGRLGHFEASAAEAQELMRPVFLFVVERPQPQDAGAGWREALVIPATECDGVALDEGLGEWSEDLNGPD
jgi:hypothetical protein